MTRQKKARKPSAVKITPVKADKDKPAKDKRIRKKVGNQPGTRQNIAKEQVKDVHYQKKDPRLGSKKPIALKPLKTAEKPTKKQMAQAVTPVVKITTELSLQERLNNIEQDALLLAIIEKQEEDIELTEAEVDHYNNLMDEHESISAKLGLNSVDESVVLDESLSEDDLWEKFNNTHFDEGKL